MKNKGLTLIEMIVAMFLMVVVVGVSAHFFMQAQRLKQKGQGEELLVQQQLDLYQQFREDLQQQLTEPKLNQLFIGTDFNGQLAQIKQNLKTVVFEPQKIGFVIRQAPAQENRSQGDMGLYWVEYELVDQAIVRKVYRTTQALYEAPLVWNILVESRGLVYPQNNQSEVVSWTIEYVENTSITWRLVVREDTRQYSYKHKFKIGA